MAVRDGLMDLPYTDQSDLWFRTKGAGKLAVLLHGMYSTPSTFEDYASRWVRARPGWDVFCPALPAGTKDTAVLQKLGPWSWDESLAVAGAKTRTAAASYQTIVLGGHSQGGSLALALAPDLDFLKALIIIASPLTLGGSNLSWDDNLGIALSGPLCLLKPKGIFKPVPHTEKRRSVEKFCDAEGLIFPLTIHTFKHGLAEVRRRLPEIRIPLFMSYCKQDSLVDFSNSAALSRSIGSSLIIRKDFDIPKKAEPYGRKHQLLNYKPTREPLSAALDEFLARF